MGEAQRGKGRARHGLAGLGMSMSKAWAPMAHESRETAVRLGQARLGRAGHERGVGANGAERSRG